MLDTKHNMFYAYGESVSRLLIGLICLQEKLGKKYRKDLKISEKMLRKTMHDFHVPEF